MVVAVAVAVAVVAAAAAAVVWCGLVGWGGSGGRGKRCRMGWSVYVFRVI